jgi:hypothetical protein
MPANQNYVMEGRGPIFDQSQDRPPVRQLAAERQLVPIAAVRGPPPAAQLVDKRVGPDPSGAAIDQMRKGFSGDSALAPVAKDHRSGSAAAQQLRLGNEGNVEKGQRFAAFALRCKVECLRRDEHAAAQGEGPHQSINGDDNQNYHQ